MKIDFQEQPRLEDAEWQKERKRLSKLEWKCVLDTAHREGYLEGYSEGYAEGYAEEKAKANNSIIINCISLGMPIEEISDLCKVSVEYVNQIIEESDSNKN
jgi:flagellar biosynthesis/type III secretory pathway protein FliH